MNALSSEQALTIKDIIILSIDSKILYLKNIGN